MYFIYLIIIITRMFKLLSEICHNFFNGSNPIQNVNKDINDQNVVPNNIWNILVINNKDLEKCFEDEMIENFKEFKKERGDNCRNNIHYTEQILKETEYNYSSDVKKKFAEFILLFCDTNNDIEYTKLYETASKKEMFYGKYTVSEHNFDFVSQDKTIETIINSVDKKAVVGGGYALWQYLQLIDPKKINTEVIKRSTYHDIDIFYTCVGKEEHIEKKLEFEENLRNENIEFKILSQYWYPQNFFKRVEYVNKYHVNKVSIENFNMLIKGSTSYSINGIETQLIFLEEIEPTEKMFDKISDVPACICFKSNSNAKTFYVPSFFTNVCGTGLVPEVLLCQDRIDKYEKKGWTVFDVPRVRELLRENTFIDPFNYYVQYAGEIITQDDKNKNN